MKKCIITDNGLRYLQLLGIALVLLCSACSSSSRGMDALADTNVQPPLATGLPAVPEGTPGHVPAAVEQTTQQGSDAAAMSSGAVVSGTDLLLSPATGALEYGMFTFNASDAALLGVDVDIDAVTGSDVWVAIANHGPRLWEFHGPFTTAGAITLDNLDEGIYASLDGYTHVLVAAFNLSSTTVSSVEFTTDDTPAEVSISGNILGDPGEVPLAGVTLTLTPGGATAMTDASGNYSFSAVSEGQYVITPELADYTFSPESYNLHLQGLATDVDFYGLPEG